MSGIAHLLNATVQVWRPASTSDGQGGWIETPAYDHDERVRISPAGANEQLAARAHAGAQESFSLTHSAYGLLDADILRGDQLRVSGRIYYVLGGRSPSKPHHTKFWLSETQVSVPE